MRAVLVLALLLLAGCATPASSLDLPPCAEDSRYHPEWVTIACAFFAAENQSPETLTVRVSVEENAGLGGEGFSFAHSYGEPRKLEFRLTPGEAGEPRQLPCAISPRDPLNPPPHGPEGPSMPMRIRIELLPLGGAAIQRATVHYLCDAGARDRVFVARATDSFDIGVLIRDASGDDAPGLVEAPSAPTLSDYKSDNRPSPTPEPIRDPFLLTEWTNHASKGLQLTVQTMRRSTSSFVILETQILSLEPGQSETGAVEMKCGDAVGVAATERVPAEGVSLRELCSGRWRVSIDANESVHIEAAKEAPPS